MENNRVGAGAAHVSRVDSVDTPDGIFVNNSLYSIDMSIFQSGLQAPIFYETSSTLNVTNTGTLVCIPGFDFEQFPRIGGQTRNAGEFREYRQRLWRKAV